MSNRSHVHTAALPARRLGESAVRALSETFKLLGDETRVRLLDILARTELCVQDVARILGMTQSAISHQLRLLRSMRLVRTRRDGRQIFYALDDDHIVKLFEQGLEHVEERAAPAAPLTKGRSRRRRRPVLDTRDRSASGSSERDPRARRAGVGSSRALDKSASVSSRGGGAPRE